MQNINTTNSKRPYCVSFIIINFFISYFVSGLLYMFVREYIKIGEVDSFIVFVLIFILWNIFGLYLTKKIWSDGVINTEIVYNEKFRLQVRKYRNLVCTAFIILLSSLVVLLMMKLNIISDNVVKVVIPTLFYGGLFILLSVTFYFSGVKNISANELITYPFQFISDSELRHKEIEKKIKTEKQQMFVITIILLALYLLGWLNMRYVISILIALSIVLYRFKQLRLLNL